MRYLTKHPKPQILSQNEETWTAALLNDPSNDNIKKRYKHQEVKAVLREETSWKCVYCESYIGHNTPGDVEHKAPVSKFPEKCFDWENLTVACQECNSRKNNYYDSVHGFLDPYVDNVEEVLVHQGPFVSPIPGNKKAEKAVLALKLSDRTRYQLILRKMDKLQEVRETVERVNAETDATLRSLLDLKVVEMADTSSEYSAMVKDYISRIYRAV